ncbi:MAG: gliding motility-associated C-terminal domain-containing protein [Flavobacteriales bacterium]|nr:gliding motility-associated C-terminal domain-containing protein [Flavobacteriales bacterium]
MNSYFKVLCAALLLVVGQRPLAAHDHAHANGGADAALYVQNKGQWDERVLYRAQSGNLTLFVERDRLTWVMLENAAFDLAHDWPHLSPEQQAAAMYRGHAWQVRFEGAGSTATVSHGEVAAAYHNYFIGNDRSQWASHVQVAGMVRFADLWPGVDLVLHSAQGGFKYDLELRPGADLSRVGFAYEGVDGVAIDKDGALVVRNSVGEVREALPESWYADDVHEPVRTAYRLMGNVLRFAFEENVDARRGVVIDPLLIASTFSGATGASNYGHCATFDDAGNIYTGARNFGPTYPATVGAFQTAFAGGGTDVSLSKYNPDGSSLVWASYLGGSSGENPHSMIATIDQRLVVFGSTNSANFPITASAYDATLGGTTDMFVTVVESDGGSLVGSTFMGGLGTDGTNAINLNYGDNFRGEVVLDAAGNICISGATASNDFPVTAGAYQTTLAGGQDAVVFSLDITCTSLLWSTYLGGAQNDMGFGLRVAGDGSVVVCGGTMSSGFPSTPGVYMDTYQGGTHDVFVARLSNSGTLLTASTFFGGNQSDCAFFIDLDQSGDIYIYGQSNTGIAIQPAGTYGMADGRLFIARFDPDLVNLEVSTTLGPSGTTALAPVAFLVDVCDHVYICGYNSASGMPLTPDALFTNGSFYLAAFDTDLTGLLFGTYYGGSHVDGGTSRFDKNGVIYQGVCSGMGSMVATPWAYATNQWVGWDVGVFKIDFQVSGTVANISTSALSACLPATFDMNAIGNALTWTWDLGDGSPLVTGPSVTYSYIQSGTYVVTLIGTDSASCNIADTVTIQITVSDPANLQPGFLSAPAGTCDGYFLDLTNTSTGGTQYFWDLGDGSTSQQASPSHTYNAPGSYTVTLTIVDPVCQDTASTAQQIVIPVPTMPYDLPSPQVLCADSYLVLDAGTGYDSYAWSTGPTSQTLTVMSTGNYTVTVTDGLCTASASVEVVPAPTYPPMPDGISCPGVPVTLAPTFNVQSILWNTGSTDAQLSVDESGTYWFDAIDSYGCAFSDTAIVLTPADVGGDPFVPNVFTPNGDGKNDTFRVPGLGLNAFSMMVFNRWGMKLYETTDPNRGWNGKMNNMSDLAPDGTYYYIISYRDPCKENVEETFKGVVTLLR